MLQLNLNPQYVPLLCGRNKIAGKNENIQRCMGLLHMCNAVLVDYDEHDITLATKMGYSTVLVPSDINDLSTSYWDNIEKLI